MKNRNLSINATFDNHIELYINLLTWTQKIGVIGYSISLLSLIIACLIFRTFKRLQCARNFVHINLFASLILRCIMCILTYFLQSDSTGHKIQNGVVCKSLTMIWNYSIVASYFWLLVESTYLHNRIYFVFHELNVKLYALFGWLGPCFVIIPWSIAKLKLDDSNCWIEYINVDYIWIIGGPIFAIFIINFLLFLNVIRMLYTKLKTANVTASGEYHRMKKLAKSTFILVVSFGVDYFLMMLLFISTKMEYSYLFITQLFVEHCISSIQGILVSLIYCYANSDVVEELKLWNSRRSLRKNIERSNNARHRSSSTSAKPNNHQWHVHISRLFTPAPSWRRASCPITTTTIGSMAPLNFREQNEQLLIVVDTCENETPMTLTAGLEDVVDCSVARRNSSVV